MSKVWLTDIHLNCRHYIQWNRQLQSDQQVQTFMIRCLRAITIDWWLSYCIPGGPDSYSVSLLIVCLISLRTWWLTMTPSLTDLLRSGKALMSISPSKMTIRLELVRQLLVVMIYGIIMVIKVVPTTLPMRHKLWLSVLAHVFFKTNTNDEWCTFVHFSAR